MSEVEQSAAVTKTARGGQKTKEAPTTRWVEFITSQSGFRTVELPGGGTGRGAQFTYVKGDQVEKPIAEAESLIAAGTAKPCEAPKEAAVS